MDYSKPNNIFSARQNIDFSNHAANAHTQQIMNLLAYTKTSGAAYDGKDFPAGYQTLSIGATTVKGQRNPKLRLSGLPFDFTNKTVLDIGSNQGGMLFEIADKISHGIGIDYDPRMVNVANKIRNYTQKHNLSFYIFDLGKEDLNIIRDFLPAEKVDIVFLLSVCIWISNWQDVVAFVASISKTMLFESNGNEEEQKSQFDQLKLHYSKIQIIHEQSMDDPGQKNRKLYLCEI